MSYTRLDADSMAHLPKHRRDWLEMFGNTWGSNKPTVEPLTDEEKQALSDALNPFARDKAYPEYQPCNGISISGNNRGAFKVEYGSIAEGARSF